MLAERKRYTEIAALLRQPEYEVHSFDSIMILMAIVSLCQQFGTILKVIMLRAMDWNHLSVFHTVASLDSTATGYT